MKYTTKLASTIVACVMSLALLSSCASDGTAFNKIGIPEDNQVFALPEDVKDEANFYPDVNPKTGYPDAALLDVTKVDGFAKNLIVGFFGKNVEKIVMTEAKYLIEGVDMTKVFRPVPTTLNSNGDPVLDESGLLGTITGLITTINPGAGTAATLGLYLVGLLSKRRSRGHMGDMVKAFIPSDGNIKLGDAYLSGKKAIGFEHSSEDPEVLLAVVERKKAEVVAKKTMEKAKNGGAAALAKQYDVEKIA